MRSKDNKELVQASAAQLQQLVALLPASAFTCAWHSGGKERWLRLAKKCELFPHVVELVDSLVAQLREEVFAPGVFAFALSRRGEMLRRPFYIDAARNELPGLRAWWPLRGKLVQSAAGLERLISDLRESLDQGLFVECAAPTAQPGQDHAFELPQESDGDVELPQESDGDVELPHTTVAAGMVDGDQGGAEAEAEAEDENDGDDGGVKASPMKEVELTDTAAPAAPAVAASAPTVPHVVTKDPLSSRPQSSGRQPEKVQILDGGTMRSIVQVLPMQQSCMFDTNMVDLEFLSVVQVWFNDTDLRPSFVVPGIEYVPMSSLIPTNPGWRETTLHPAVVYASPSLMEHMPHAHLDASKRHVAELNGMAQVTDQPATDVESANQPPVDVESANQPPVDVESAFIAGAYKNAFPFT